MVLYESDGRVNIVHDQRLDAAAMKFAKQNNYDEQIQVCTCKRKPHQQLPDKEKIHIVIDEQGYFTLNSHNAGC